MGGGGPPMYAGPPALMLRILCGERLSGAFLDEADRALDLDTERADPLRSPHVAI